jgi:hypothetical protein
MKATLNSMRRLTDGTYLHGKPYEVDAMVKPLWWQEQGLSFTASGYGKRIPTRYMVRLHGKWRRVYCCIHSNSGTCYVGNLFATGEVITVGDIS